MDDPMTVGTEVQEFSAAPECRTDMLMVYLHDIARTPLLSAEEEWRLGRAIRRADAALASLRRTPIGPEQEAALWRMVLEGRRAARQMVEAILRLVISVAKKYANRGISFEDLVQEGNLGLLRAVRRYDYRLHLRFSTYATCWIRQAMLRAIGEHGRTLRLPAHMAEAVCLLRNASRRLQQDLNREPTVDELALEVGYLTDEERQQIGLYLQTHTPLPCPLAKRMTKARERVRLILASTLDPVSLESPIGESDDCALSEFLTHSQDAGPDDEVFAQMLKESLAATMNDLTPREQMVLRYRYGLGDGEAMTLEEIGRELGVTRERVRQIEQKALLKLRSRADGLVSYLA